MRYAVNGLLSRIIYVRKHTFQVVWLSYKVAYYHRVLAFVFPQNTFFFFFFLTLFFLQRF